MPTISLRLSEKEDQLIRTYADLHKLDLSSFIRHVIIERIEDEIDMSLFKELKDDRKKRLTHQEVMDQLKL